MCKFLKWIFPVFEIYRIIIFSLYPFIALHRFIVQSKVNIFVTLFFNMASRAYRHSVFPVTFATICTVSLQGGSANRDVVSGKLNIYLYHISQKHM